jgi:hypothetical protein
MCETLHSPVDDGLLSNRMFCSRLQWQPLNHCRAFASGNSFENGNNYATGKKHPESGHSGQNNYENDG